MPYGESCGLRCRLAAVVASATLAWAGCGTGEAPPAPQPTPAPQPAPATPTDEAIAWTGSMCSDLVPVVEALRTPPRVNLANGAATRQAYLDYLGDAQQRAEQARRAVDVAEPAPVPGGAEVVQDVRDRVAELREDLASARARVEAANPGDTAAVGEAIAAAGSVLGSLGNSAQARAAISVDPQLHLAFERAQPCEPLRTIAGPS